MPDRGQTETLGFVLVFALITASIGLVYATGFTGLNDIREFEQVNNAERAFEVLADNIEDMTHRHAPSRSTEIKLSDAELRIGDAIQIEVNDPDSSYNATYDIRPVIYDADTGTELVYVQGAVMRVQDSGAGVVITEGTFLLDANRTVIPVVQSRLAGSGGSVAGSTTVLLRADMSQTRLVHASTVPDNQVWFNVTSPRAEIWHEYLTEQYDDASCSVSIDTVSCSVTTDRVYVTLYQIDFSIEN